MLCKSDLVRVSRELKDTNGMEMKNKIYYMTLFV